MWWVGVGVWVVGGCGGCGCGVCAKGAAEEQEMDTMRQVRNTS